MATQVINGKAFEWAVATACAQFLGVEIESSAAAKKAKESHQLVGSALQMRFKQAATLSVAHIFQNANAKVDLLPDGRGELGDVRDIVINLGDREVGLSCKSNHSDLKHSRLSHRANFVKKWGLDALGCSEEYKNAISPIFKELQQIRKESNRTALFENLNDKPSRFYWPVLDAFSQELLRLQAVYKNMPKTLSENLLSYLIGSHDFYKIIVEQKQVIIQGFNFKGTLSIPKSKYPKEILGVDNKNGTSYSKTVRFTGGYSINFRIHNGDSLVMPSLKFAVSAISYPPRDIYTQNIVLDIKAP